MNQRKTFRSRFDMKMHQLQDKAGELESTVREQAVSLADQARQGLMRGKDAVMSWESVAEKSIRENPTLYLGIALTLVGLLLAKMIYDRRG